jgi:hypothetical protein
MIMARTRSIVVCLFVLLASSGCTSRMAGRATGELLVGLISVVASAAIDGASRSGTGHSYAMPPPPTCETKLAEWQETHQNPPEVPPPYLRCTPDGDWPDPAEVTTAAAPLPGDGGSARTTVASSICGGTETERERCEGQRALREQREKERERPW